jgi:hypothetical protein
MTGQWRLLSASLLVAWVALVVGCGGGGDQSGTSKEAADGDGATKPAVQVQTEAERQRLAGTATVPRKAEEAKAWVSPQEALRRTVRHIPIKSYAADDAWRQSATLKGERVRLTGKAEVKRTANGVYAVFKLPTGQRIATVSVKNEDAEPLAGIKVGEGATLNVNLETTVKGSVSGQLALSDAEFLPLDAPEGFVTIEEYPAETGRRSRSNKFDK